MFYYFLLYFYFYFLSKNSYSYFRPFYFLSILSSYSLFYTLWIIYSFLLKFWLQFLLFLSNFVNSFVIYLNPRVRTSINLGCRTRISRIDNRSIVIPLKFVWILIAFVSFWMCLVVGGHLVFLMILDLLVFSFLKKILFHLSKYEITYFSTNYYLNSITYVT